MFSVSGSSKLIFLGGTYTLFVRMEDAFSSEAKTTERIIQNIFLFSLGGRNVTVSLQSRSGQNHMPSIVGLFVFSHFWYWFPLSHFLSLAFTPTSLIGLNHDLKVSSTSFIISITRTDFVVQ